MGSCRPKAEEEEPPPDPERGSRRLPGSHSKAESWAKSVWDEDRRLVAAVPSPAHPRTSPRASHMLLPTADVSAAICRALP